MVLTDGLDDVGVFDESLEPLEGTGRFRPVRRRGSRELTPNPRLVDTGDELARARSVNGLRRSTLMGT